jgi:two-component system response regulator AtoC
MSDGPRILVAEDDARARDYLATLLKDEGYAVETAADGREAWRLLEDGRFVGLLLDVQMPGKDGLTILRELQALAQPPAVVVMTAYGSSSVAIEAMKLGAYDYLTKPLHFDELLIQLARAVAARDEALELEAYRGDARGEDEPSLVGGGPAMQQVYKLIGQVAPTGSTVLIRGESGTGKELVAKALHAHSARRDRPLVSVNCVAIPETLLEAELFGHEKGAFTGAVGRRRGRFELAEGGTIFLDEIGELSGTTQVKLLRVLQDRVIERLGSEQPTKLDVRIIAATNRNLESAVEEGAFREDLYYRLNVVAIVIPSLRERREDIPELAEHLLRRLARERRLAPGELSAGAVERLQAHDWPGNVRELEHALERALILSRGGRIAPEHLGLSADAPPASDLFAAVPLEKGMHEAVAELERCLIERALAEARGNRTRAAQILKINRRLLYDKLQEFGIR